MLLVILGLLITLVLSLASRSLSDSALARQEREQSATFTVAESGIEEALRLLKQGTLPTGSTITDAAGQITGEYLVSAQNRLEMYLREGEVAHLDMTGYGGGTILVYWTKREVPTENVACVSEGSGNAPAAIEAVVVNGAAATERRAYYNPSNCGLSANGFGASSDGGANYLSAASIAVPAGTTMLRLRPIYHGATVSVSGVSLASQFYLIQSAAEGGDSKKEIEVRRSIDHPASVFDFAVFSGTTIVK